MTRDLQLLWVEIQKSYRKMLNFLETRSRETISNELMDVWRLPGEAFVNPEEDRFIKEEGYPGAGEEAAQELMRQHSLSA